MEQFHLYVLVFAGVMVFAQSASILSNLGGSANGTAFAAYLGYAVALGVVSLCASLGAGAVLFISHHPNGEAGGTFL